MKSRGTSLLVISLIIAVALVVCACSTSSSGSFTTKKYSHSMNNDGVKGTYESFVGNRAYTKELKAGAVIKVTVTTNSGSMTLTVTAPDGTVLLNEAQAGEYTVNADTDGKYEVKFTSGEHSGGYTVSW